MFKARFKVAESPDVFCAELSSLMALFGHGAMSDLSPLSGVKRKLDFGAVRAAFDPERTFLIAAAFQGAEHLVASSHPLRSINRS